ncbi:MAG: hypothetical protein ACYCS1_07695 [Gammaproteobacteria bacterium]
MASTIELLGATLDKKPFDEPRLSKERFNAALNGLNAFGRYRDFINTAHDLYQNVRCGMAHVVLVGRGVALTQKDDPNDGMLHLQKISFKRVDRLILVCEDLYADIVNAVKEVKSDARYSERLNNPFLNPALVADA